MWVLPPSVYIAPALSSAKLREKLLALMVKVTLPLEDAIAPPFIALFLLNVAASALNRAPFKSPIAPPFPSISIRMSSGLGQ